MFLYIGKELGWSCICKLFSKVIYYRFPKSCEVAHKPIGQAQNPDICKALAMKGRVLQRQSCSFLKERPFLLQKTRASLINSAMFHAHLHLVRHYHLSSPQSGRAGAFQAHVNNN